MEGLTKHEIKISSEIKVAMLELRCIDASVSDLMTMKYVVDKELERRGCLNELK